MILKYKEKQKNMFYIRKFDPWNSKLCTCPFKWTFNPYTGCSNKCIYCYASTYIRDFYNPRPKRIDFRKFEEDAKKIKGMIISISNSTDPYQPLEREYRITRRILEILIRHHVRIEILTKSDLVVRDLDLLEKGKVAVVFTITTLNKKIASKIEPFASPPKKRIKVAEKLVKSGIPVIVRYDPIIPLVNEKEWKMIKKLARIGVKQIISSTLKIRPKIWQRFSIIFPNISKKLKTLYFEKGEKINNYLYLPKDERLRILKEVKEKVEEYGMKFSVCREGLEFLNSAPTCDGTWLTLKIKHEN